MHAHPFSRAALAVAALVCTTAAQVPAPVSAGARAVHPGIADPGPSAVRHGSAPRLQYVEPTPRWDHGEGFAPPGEPDADRGGWFGDDDGAHLTAADVHTAGGFETFVWNEPFGPVPPGRELQRMVGWLRPADLPLPTVHPLYGVVGPHVDQGAFEVFRPAWPYDPERFDKVVVVVQAWGTLGFPTDHLGRRLLWYQVYPGLFSPDGLLRDEQQRSGDGFLANTSVDTVRRPRGYADLLVAPDDDARYYPIVVYAVPSVARRQTTLNEQRCLQVARAVELLLQEDGERNPLGSGRPLAATGPSPSVERDVVTVWAGTSNGGLTSSLALMRRPDRVHGALSVVFHPSMPRQFGENDLAIALSRRSASAARGALIDEHDVLDWGQYAWGQQRRLHDFSYPRRFALGDVFRPVCYAVGDEDVTSTGADWVALAHGAGWTPSGRRRSAATPSWPVGSELAWSVGENGCHGEGLFLEDPYGGGTTVQQLPLLRGLIARAVADRQAQLAENAQTTPVPSRPVATSMRGLDDPHEWALGRPGEPMPPSGDDAAGPLVRDDAWFEATQPGAAGTWLGHGEAMRVHDGRVYVVGVEGVVTAFEVARDQNGAPIEGAPLVKVAHGNDGGPGAAGRPRPLALGHDAAGLCVFEQGASGVEVLVGTRRHLHRLAADTLRLLQTVELPWQVARPHHLQVATVLPGLPAQLVHASVHGGLVFHDAATFAPIFEWPEPGIVDFAIDGRRVTILSRRGVVAELTFVAADAGAALPFRAVLLRVSRAIPRRLGPDAAGVDPALDPPCEGDPIDLEAMRADWRAFGLGVPRASVALWTGDEDGTAVRAYVPPLFAGSRYVENATTALAGVGGRAIATCRQPRGTDPVAVGDHLLLLQGDNLSLYDQFGHRLAQKALFLTAGPVPFLPAGYDTHALAVGELVDDDAAGSDGPYDEEVVVATRSGALLWLHVDDLLEPVPTPTVRLPGAPLPVALPHLAIALPARYSPAAVDGDASEPVLLPHANRSLSATWAMARRADEPGHLHVLDQRGAMFRVGAAGDVALVGAAPVLRGMRTMQDLGNRGAGGVPLPILPGDYGAGRVQVQQVLGATFVGTRPWCPLDVFSLSFEDPATGRLADNWQRATTGTWVYRGFSLQGRGGATLGDALWFWSSRAPLVDVDTWGNLVEGVRLQAGSDAWRIAGLWSSTGPAADPGPQSFVPYERLRSFASDVPIMDQQALVPIALDSGETVLVLGCPGGRVRVLRPAFGTPSTPHGRVGATSSSADFGVGASALAARAVGADGVEVWVAAVYGNTPLPAAYGSSSEQAELGVDELATGVVRRLRWTPGEAGDGTFEVLAERRLSPSASDGRGGYAVVGMCLADLLPDGDEPQHELVVATSMGDVLVLDPSTLQTRWRTHVAGSAGCYGSLRVEDLDGDGLAELYVAGSFGLWRFVRAGAQLR